MKILRQLKDFQNANDYLFTDVYIIGKEDKEKIKETVEENLNQSILNETNYHIKQFDINKDLYELYKFINSLVYETLTNPTRYLIIHYLLYPEHLQKVLKILKLLSLQYAEDTLRKNFSRVKLLIEKPLINLPDNALDYPLCDIYYIDHYSGKDILWSLLSKDIAIPFNLLPQDTFEDSKEIYSEKKEKLIYETPSYLGSYTLDCFFELREDDLDSLRNRQVFLSEYGCYYDMIHSHAFTTLSMLSLLFRELVNGNSQRFSDRFTISQDYLIRSLYGTGLLFPFQFTNEGVQLFKHKDVYDKFENETAIFIFNQNVMSNETNIISGKGLGEKRTRIVFKLRTDNWAFPTYKEKLKGKLINVYFYMELYPNPQVKIVEEDIFNKDDIRRKVIYENKVGFKRNEYLNIYNKVINEDKLFKSLFGLGDFGVGLIPNTLRSYYFVKNINEAVERERKQGIFFEYSGFDDIKVAVNNLCKFDYNMVDNVEMFLRKIKNRQRKKTKING